MCKKIFFLVLALIFSLNSEAQSNFWEILKVQQAAIDTSIYRVSNKVEMNRTLKRQIKHVNTVLVYFDSLIELMEAGKMPDTTLLIQQEKKWPNFHVFEDSTLSLSILSSKEESDYFEYLTNINIYHLSGDSIGISLVVYFYFKRTDSWKVKNEIRKVLGCNSKYAIFKDLPPEAIVKQFITAPNLCRFVRYENFYGPVYTCDYNSHLNPF